MSTKSMDMRMTEQERNDKFVRACGSVHKADRIQQIWGMSYSGFGKTKEQIFTDSAMREGFTKKQIKMFMDM